MADIKGIELASDIYGLEDETARDNSEINTSAIGTLANLETTAKTNLVAAINELVTPKDVSNQIAVNDTYLERNSTDVERTGVFVCGKVAMVLFPFHAKEEVPLYTTLLTGLPKPKKQVFGLMRCVSPAANEARPFKIDLDGQLILQGSSPLPVGTSSYQTFVYITD